MVGMTSGLVGYWPLNTQHGAHDVSGYGNDGQDFGTERAEGPGGKTGGSFYFAGNPDSRVEFPNNGALDTRTYMTLQAWINPEVEGSSGPIFSYQRSITTDLYSYGVNLWLYPDQTTLCVQFDDVDGNKSQTEVSEGGIKGGEWQFVTATYNLTSGLATLYVNAEQVAQRDVGKNDLATPHPVVMGGKPEVNGSTDKRCFKGRIAHMQVYNIALTKEQIKYAMEYTKKGYH